eukprot:3910489-Pleurochrysis_carterae.AAC.2
MPGWLRRAWSKESVLRTDSDRARPWSGCLVLASSVTQYIAVLHRTNPRKLSAPVQSPCYRYTAAFQRWWTRVKQHENDEQVDGKEKGDRRLEKERAYGIKNW